ncbi:MAG: HD domain-containing protein [Sulfurimonas sp.]|uniref:HD-GYP domain-containing protein n=1 Tax=Sulfurimonas sp. TaxID=2022749 RepID=UPI0026367E64|nr:HD domain-containing phosphohydrolase [Sulfurimonas sp.]MDD2652531.1 HD domain-containing protein [Sulfurimonas sp.]MDD3451294.1 HD domain-containing protein [Sulfurimonas sp.]
MKIVKTKLDYSHLYTLLDINSIVVGEIIPYDICIKKNEEYIIIIEAGTLISEALHAKLQKQEALYIAKADETKQILSCESLKYYIRHNRDNPKKRIELLYDVTEQLFEIFMNHPENKIHANCVTLIIKSIIYLIKHDSNFARSTMPHFINNDALVNHSLHVAIYSLILGNKLRFSDEQLLQLGTAAILHDVGLKKIDHSVIEKTTGLSEAESKNVQQHPKYSVEIIEQNKIHDPYILDAVMHHHERYDGSGYPNHLTKSKISDFASILAICDVFDALTSVRPHRKQYSSFEALKMMMKDSEMVNQFNQKYLLIALKLL